MLWLALGICAGRSAVATPQPGQPFPDWRAYELAGDVPDTQAAKVVIVDFWASWCAPCKQSFPIYDQLQREYGAKGVVIVAVNIDDDPRAMQRFLDRLRPGFAVVRDVAQKLVAAVAVPAMPTAFVLDRRGIVRFVHEGFFGERTRAEYVAEIETLLSENP